MSCLSGLALPAILLGGRPDFDCYASITMKRGKGVALKVSRFHFHQMLAEGGS
jgi:hypothetical protein